MRDEPSPCAVCAVCLGCCNGVAPPTLTTQAAQVPLTTQAAQQSLRGRRRTAGACGNAAALACGHAFHAACIERWLLLRAACPVCRAPAPERALEARRARAAAVAAAAAVPLPPL